LNWIKASHKLPPLTDGTESYSQRLIVITDEGADFGYYCWNKEWVNDINESIKVYYWLDMPNAH